MKEIINELAPCGVFCGACPSFNKSCFGCASEFKEGTRTKSRAGCKVRTCCYETKKIDYCAKCDEFPCDKINKKLVKSHAGDPKFKYRHELPIIALEFKKSGIKKFIEEQRKRWACPSCGGLVHFYHHKCSKCGESVDV